MKLLVYRKVIILDSMMFVLLILKKIQTGISRRYTTTVTSVDSPSILVR